MREILVLQQISCAVCREKKTTKENRMKVSMNDVLYLEKADFTYCCVDCFIESSGDDLRQENFIMEKDEPEQETYVFCDNCGKRIKV